MTDPGEEGGHPLQGWLIGTAIILLIFAIAAGVWIHVHGV
jgi:hypothetical protein